MGCVPHGLYDGVSVRYNSTSIYVYTQLLHDLAGLCILLGGSITFWYLVGTIFVTVQHRGDTHVTLVWHKCCVSFVPILTDRLLLMLADVVSRWAVPALSDTRLVKRTRLKMSTLSAAGRPPEDILGGA